MGGATKGAKGHEGKRRRKMIPMGNTFMKHGTMVDRESKVLWGIPKGAVFQKSPLWPSETENKNSYPKTH